MHQWSAPSAVADAHAWCDPYRQERASAAANTPLLSLLFGAGGRPKNPDDGDFSQRPSRARRGVAMEMPFFATPQRQTVDREHVGAALPVASLEASLLPSPITTSVQPALRRPDTGMRVSGGARRGPAGVPTVLDDTVTAADNVQPGSFWSNDDGAKSEVSVSDAALLGEADERATVPFRARMRETEKRFQEQLEVHRGLNTALRDVKRIQKEANVLEAEKKITALLAMLRVKQEALFERLQPFDTDAVVSSPASPYGSPVFPQSAAALSLIPTSTGVGSPSSPSATGAGLNRARATSPSAVSVPPTGSPTGAALSNSEVSNPLRDVIAAFSKPRKSSPSQPQPTDGRSEAVRSAVGSDAARKIRARGVEIVDLQPKEPQAYVQIRWVQGTPSPSPVATLSDEQRKPQQEGSTDGGSSGARGASPSSFHEASVRSLSNASAISSPKNEESYADDFDSADPSEGGRSSNIGSASSAPHDEEAADGDGSTHSGTRSPLPSTVDSVQDDASGTSDSHAESNAHSGSGDSVPVDTDVEDERNRGGRHNNSDFLTEGTATRRRDDRAALTRVLGEFYNACQGANQLMQLLSGGAGDGEGAAGGGSEVVHRANKTATAAVAAAAVQGDLADIRRLQRFGERLQNHLQALDVVRRVHRSKISLLQRVQKLAKAHQTMTEKEEALLEEVVPNARALLSSLRESRTAAAEKRAARVKDRRKTHHHPSARRSAGIEEDFTYESIQSDESVRSRSTVSGRDRRHTNSVEEVIDEVTDSSIVSGSGSEAIATEYGDEVPEESVLSASEEEIRSAIDDIVDVEDIYDSNSFESSVESEVVEEDDDDQSSAAAALDDAITEAIQEESDALGISNFLVAAASAVAGTHEELEDVEEDFALRLANTGSIYSVSIASSIVDAVGNLPENSLVPESIHSDGASMRGGSPLHSTAESKRESRSDASPVRTISSVDEAALSASPIRSAASSSSSTSSYANASSTPPESGSEATAQTEAVQVEVQKQATARREWEAQLAATQHRRTRALRRVQAPRTSGSSDDLSSIHSERGASRRHHVSLTDRETFTQLYDPNASSMSSTLSEEDSEQSPETQHNSLVSPRQAALLRFKALDAASKSTVQARLPVFFAERDVLSSELTEELARRGDGRPRVGTAEKLSARTHGAPSLRTPSLTSTAEDMTTREYLTDVPRAPDVAPAPPPPAVTESTKTTANDTEEERPEQSRVPRPLPNLREDFVALTSWKTQEIALVQQLRRFSCGPQSRSDLSSSASSSASSTSLSSGARSPRAETGPAQATEPVSHALERGDSARVSVESDHGGEFDRHWGALTSLLETRFGRRGRPDAQTDWMLDSVDGYDPHGVSEAYFPSMYESAFAEDSLWWKEQERRELSLQRSVPLYDDSSSIGSSLSQDEEEST